MKHLLTNNAKAKVVQNISAYLLNQYKKISSAYIFGSFITSDAFSDIDLGVLTNVELEKPLNFELELENRLERIIKYPVDARILNGAPVSFCQNVFRKGEVIVDRDPNQRADFEGRILKQYFDFSYFRREYLKEVLNAPI
ncbi:MAG: nucleotidyltransferase domain-containing protein [Deltaproteobacteria bacterium]|nr:nucleotidyltransferase domain-containing protein [Deltaproteobacteria bacterium]